MKPSQLKGEKKMKWKKDETAKCGPFTYAKNGTGGWYLWILTFNGQCRINGQLTEKQAETWLRKQATQMLKDLGAPNE